MFELQVSFKIEFLVENTRANVALEGLNVADTMHSTYMQVSGKTAFLLDDTRANVALEGFDVTIYIRLKMNILGQDPCTYYKKNPIVTEAQYANFIFLTQKFRKKVIEILLQSF